jgi:6-methylsalicylate decarboxylase
MFNMVNSGIIDVHQHCFPPNYKKILDDCGITVAAMLNSPPVTNWTVESHLKGMDENGIAVGMLSITGGFLYSRRLTRECNEYFARLISDYPNRFGAFAVLPFPDLDGCLKEVEYAIDQLKLDGVGLLTNVKGHYPADPEYAELFKELNRRKMVVCMHPNDPPFGDLGKVKVPWAMVEFPMETTRAVSQMLFGGTFDLCPEARFILPHAGGAIPFVAGRIARSIERVNVIEHLKKQYYDTSGSAFAYALRSLHELVEPSQVLFGSDFGMKGGDTTNIVRSIKGLNEYYRDDKKTLQRIERENALELFARFKRR